MVSRLAASLLSACLIPIAAGCAVGDPDAVGLTGLGSSGAVSSGAASDGGAGDTGDATDGDDPGTDTSPGTSGADPSGGEAGTTGDDSASETGSDDGATSAESTTGADPTGADPTAGGNEDPNYPAPNGTSCPPGFVLLYVLDGGVLCTMECPNDGTTTCQLGATGNADPWCSFPSETASNEDCTMTGTCTVAGETCVAFTDASLCRDTNSRCGLWCGANERTCPDGMSCQSDFCGY